MVETFSESAAGQSVLPKEWKSSGTGGQPPQEAAVAIVEAQPLRAGGGAYLNVAVTSEGTNKRWNVHRHYPVLDSAEPYTVSFLFRLDEALGGRITPNFAKMVFFDWNGTASPLAASTENATWAIQSTRESSTPEWILSTGAGFDEAGNILDGVSSEVYLQLGDVYAFTVWVDPARNRYRARVENLNYEASKPGAASHTSGWLDFALKSGLGGKAVVFLEHKRRGEGQVAFSLDDVRVQPGLAEEVAP